MKDNLLDARKKHEPGSSQYNQALADVLKELYSPVGKPVLDRLRQLKVPEQSRVWWCLTSILSSLPLHFMYLIPSDDGNDERYFLDLYITYYTPTLSALARESDPHGPTRGLLSIPLVAYFDVRSPNILLSDFELHPNNDARITFLETVRSCSRVFAASPNSRTE